MASDDTKILLSEADIPTHWSNVIADMPNPPSPPLHPRAPPNHARCEPSPRYRPGRRRCLRAG